MANKLYKFRRASLVFAETIDTWRIIPRLMLLAYGIMIVHVFLWYKSIPTVSLFKCDPISLKIFIDAGVAVDQAKAIACSIVDTIGGPTTSQTAFVSAVYGLAPVIFGLYTATGPKWNQVDYDQLTAEPIEPTEPVTVIVK